MRRRHKCFVPNCPNSVSKTQDKLFFHVNNHLRRKWCKQLNIVYNSQQRRLYCCEDHFNLNEDLDNYYQWKLMKARPRLKLTAVLKYSLENLSSCTKIQPETESNDVHSSPQKEIPERDQGTSGDESTDEVDDDESLYEHSESPVRTAGAEGSSGCHEGYRCDVCCTYIVGFRYTCVECPSWELCGACEARGQHAQHYVLRVPSCKQHTEVQAVVQKIRDELFREDADSIKMEIKEEKGIEEQDPLQQTADPLQRTSCQNISEDSGEPLAVKHFGFIKGGELPVFKVQSQRSEVQSHWPSVQSHRAEVESHHTEVKSHLSEVKSHRSEVQSHQSEVKSYLYEILSRGSEVQSHRSEVQLDKRPLVLKGQCVDKLSVLAGEGEGSFTMAGRAGESERAGGAGHAGVREEAEDAGRASLGVGGSYAVFTRRAHHSRTEECTLHEEPPSLGDEAKSTRKKRKK